MTMSILNTPMNSGNSKDSSTDVNSEANRDSRESFLERASTITLVDFNGSHSSEKSNEEQERDENFIADAKRESISSESKEWVLPGKKYLRLGIEGALPIQSVAELNEVPLDLPEEILEPPMMPNGESVPDDTQVTLEMSNVEQEMEPMVPVNAEFRDAPLDFPDGILEPPMMASGQDVPDDTRVTLDLSNVDQEREPMVPVKEPPKDPLTHGIIYPDVELLPRPPFLLDYYRTCPDEENECWATSPRREREESKGTLSLLLLKKSLAKFSYEVYGFTALHLSGKSLTDISLFARLPMTFSALTHVDLSHNRLTDISALSGLTTVTHLDVSHNRLKKLLYMYPEWYWNVDEPGKLDIEGNAARSVWQLSSCGWALCGVGISQLRWVNYSHNLIRSLEGPKHWAHFPYLSYLDLSHNHISDLHSEDRDSGETTVSPDGVKGCNEDSAKRCGLASLTVLHTLNISNNFISRVEGLNGLCVHNLILSNNSISSWEGETGQLYEEERYANVRGNPGTDFDTKEAKTDSNVTSSDELKEESVTMTADAETKFDETYSREEGDVSVSEELLEPYPTPEILDTPTICVTRVRNIVRNGTREENGEGDAGKNLASSAEDYPSPLTVEVLFTEADRKKEKIPIEILYKCKNTMSIDEKSSEDVSAMDPCYLEANEDGDYTTRRRRLNVLHSPERLKFSEDEPSDTNLSPVSSLIAPVGSVSCRKSQASASIKLNSFSGDGPEEVPADNMSVSSMFDYEWEGYEPDDPCFAKDRKGTMAPARRRTTKKDLSPVQSKVEVLYRRESTPSVEGESHEEYGDADSEALVERIYEEWDDPEVHVLCEPRLELDSDYGSKSAEVSQAGVESEEGVRVLYQAECSKGLLSGKALDDLEEDSFEVLFKRSNGHPDALVESEVQGSKSLEVLFRRDEHIRESCIGLDQEDDGIFFDEKGGEESSTADRVEVSFEIYEPVDTDESEEGSEVPGEVDELKNASFASGEEGSVSESRPEKIQADLITRINTNRFKEYVGIRSLKWLTELHLESNKLTSLRVLRGTLWLRSLFLQDNLIQDIGEIMYLNELHQLTYLDMTGNPVCNFTDFQKTTMFIVPSLLYLNQVSRSDLDEERPQEIIYHKNPFFRAARIVQNLLFASELRTGNQMAWSCPELDALPYIHAPYPVLLLVGPEGSRNKELCKSLSDMLPDKVYMSKLITNKSSPNFQRYVSTPPSNGKQQSGDSNGLYSEDPTSSFRIYRPVPEEKFLELLSAGSFASVTEEDGYLFGFDKCDGLRASREGKVLVAAVDLTTALVLHLSEFCGKPRLVMVLPESISLHEKNLRRERRFESFAEEEDTDHLTVPTPSSSSEGYFSGCEVLEGFTLSRSLLAEQEFARRNLEARQECLTVHHNSPEVFHCGIYSDDKDSAIAKLVAIVEEMYTERRNLNICQNKPIGSYWRSASVSKDIDDLINARLERELQSCIPMWE